MNDAERLIKLMKKKSNERFSIVQVAKESGVSDRRKVSGMLEALAHVGVIFYDKKHRLYYYSKKKKR